MMFWNRQQQPVPVFAAPGELPMPPETKEMLREYNEQIRRREFAMEQAATASTGEPSQVLALADSIYQWLYGETK